jgi:hypothetical protein
MVLVHAERLQLLFGGRQVGLGVLLRVLGLLQHGLRDGAVLEQILGAHVSLVGQLLVVGGLQIGVEALVMSGLCTLKSNWPFFTLSSSRALMSTTRPLASEMTGTSREMSGRPSRWRQLRGGLDLAAAVSGNLARLVDGDQVHVAGLDHLRGGGAPSPSVLEFFAAGESSPAKAARQAAQASGIFKKGSSKSLDYLASHGKIQLSGGRQIGADQLQIGQLHHR